MAYRTNRPRRLPVIIAVLLFILFVYFMTRRSMPICSLDVQKEQDLFIYKRVLQDFVRKFEENAIPFMIFGSTLLGSFRHHGLIPYDDNIIHFAINGSHLEFIRGVLVESNNTDSFNFTSYDIDDDTIFVCPLRPIGPSIRISNFVHVEHGLRFSFANKTLPLSAVFPLTFRPFESLMLPSPACPQTVLSHFYDLNKCCRLPLHSDPRDCVPCHSLISKTTFVERQRYTDHLMHERLWKGNIARGKPHILKENTCDMTSVQLRIKS